MKSKLKNKLVAFFKEAIRAAVAALPRGGRIKWYNCAHEEIQHSV